MTVYVVHIIYIYEKINSDQMKQNGRLIDEPHSELPGTSRNTRGQV